MGGIHITPPAGGGPVSAEMVSVTNTPYATQQQVNNSLLYVPLAITGFGHSHGVRLKGSTLADVVLAWSYNKAVASQTLGGVAQSAALRAYTYTGANLTATTTYALAATDGTTPRSANATVYFSNEVRYGVAAVGAGDSAFVNALPSVVLVAGETRARSFTVTAGAGEYIWYAYPTRLGTATFIIGGFEETFSVTTVARTNAAGFTENYYLCRSANAGLGLTTVTVQ